MRSSRFFPVFLFPCCLLAACGGNGAASPAPVATFSPTVGESPTPAAVETPAPAPTEKSAPPEITPTQAESPDGETGGGPYAVFEGENGIWIANPDGSLIRRIAEQGLTPGLDLRDAISPGGDRLALAAEIPAGLDLWMIEIPGGETTILSHLIKVTRVDRMLNSLSPEALAYDAIADFPNIAWQPGGGILAYTGAEKGPTADLYTFDRTWEKMRRLDTDPSQAVHPIWSPDGLHLLFFGVNWLPPLGPTYVTFDPMALFRAVRVSDNTIIPQPLPEGTHRNFLGWRDDTHYLVYDSDKQCPARDLRTVDLTTGETSVIADFRLSSRPVLSPVNGAILIATDAGCGCSLGTGVFLLFPGSSEPLRLQEQTALELYWLPESGVFYSYPQALFSSDGGVRFEPPAPGASYHPAISKKGNQAWEVIAEHRSRLMVRTSGGDWRTVLEEKIGAMLWDPLTGETLLIALENGELYTATAPDFTPRKTGDLIGPIEQAAWTR
jgi:hypothetical protein